MKSMLFFSILIGYPFLEIYTTLLVGDYLGFWFTALWIFLAMILGGFLIKSEQGELVFRILNAVREQRSFKYALLDSGLSIVAGILFIIPGILSDCMGVLLLLMPSEWLPFVGKNEEKSKDQTINMNQNQYSAHYESDQNSSSNQKRILIEGEFKKDDH